MTRGRGFRDGRDKCSQTAALAKDWRVRIEIAGRMETPTGGGAVKDGAKAGSQTAGPPKFLRPRIKLWSIEL